MTREKQLMNYKTGIDIANERCISCKSKLDTAVKEFNFIDKITKTAFMEKHRFPLDSKMCSSCVKGFMDYDPIESILANTKEMQAEELFVYLNREETSLKLIRSKRGMESLIKITNKQGRSALHEVVSKHESAALELIKTDGGRKLLASTKDVAGWSALHEAVSRHASVAAEMVKTQAGVKLLANTKDNGGRSVLHMALRHKMAAVEMMKHHGWAKILEDTKDNFGKTVLHVAAHWHKEIAVELVSGLHAIKRLHKISYSVGYGNPLSVLFTCIEHEEAAMKAAMTPGGIEVLAIDGLDEYGFGRTALHEVVSKHRKVAMALIQTEEGRRWLARTNKHKRGFYKRWSALYSALQHEEVRLKMIGTKEGRKFLSHKPEGGLVNGIEIAISYDPKGMVSKFLKIKGGREYVQNTRYDNLLPPTRMQRLLAFASGFIKIRAG